MYRLTLDDGNQIHVQYKNHRISYGLDGSLPNPLEATYAALAGCAGVYSRKACKSLGISSAGIEISCKPMVKTGGNLLIPSRFVTEVKFPEQITAVQRQTILDEISRCAVKQLIHDGASIEFVAKETTSIE
jgi:uncharacterized OsmC-like protein